MRRASVRYVEGLRERLPDPVQAVAYLNAALENGDQAVVVLPLHGTTGVKP